MIVAEVLQNLPEEKIQAKPRCCSVGVRAFGNAGTVA
jgi:hypothetical protein